MTIDGWYSGRRVLVLGGAGFIGSNLARECVARGATVTVIDGFMERTGANIDNLAGVRERIDLVSQRVEQVDGLGKRLAGVDLIIDAMALTAHHVGLADPLYDLELNAASHLHVIRLLRETPGKRVIYLGSRGQYGRVAGETIDEETPQVPVDAQGVSKLAAEQYFRIYSALYQFNIVSLRIPNCYGENQPVSGPDIGLVGSFIRDLLAGKTVEIFASAERTKNVLYGADLARAILEVGAQPLSGFNAYNVAGREVTLGELLDALVGIIGQGGWRVTPFPENIRQMDIGEARLLDDKLCALIGPLPRTELLKALQNTVDFFKNYSL